MTFIILEIVSFWKFWSTWASTTSFSVLHFYAIFCAWIRLLSKTSVCTFTKCNSLWKLKRTCHASSPQDNIEDHMSSQNNVTEKKTTIFKLLQRWKDIFWIVLISCRSDNMNIATFLLLYWKTLTPWCVLHCKCCLKPKTEELYI